MTEDSATPSLYKPTRSLMRTNEAEFMTERIKASNSEYKEFSSAGLKPISNSNT